MLKQEEWPKYTQGTIIIVKHILLEQYKKLSPLRKRYFQIRNLSKLFQQKIINVINFLKKTELNSIRGAYDKFPDFFHMGTFIDNTHMKLYSPSK